MSLTIIVQILVFVVATIALLLNINAAVGLSNAQHDTLNVDIHHLSEVPSSYPISLDNVTINEEILRTLSTCTDYVKENVPVIPPFDPTIIIDLSTAEQELTALQSLMGMRGMIQVVQSGSVYVTEINATIPYSLESLFFANVSLDNVGIDPTVTYYVTQNGTTGLTFDDWNPSIGLVGTSGYNSIWDQNQLDIQTALPVMLVKKKTFIGTAIIVGDADVAVNAGDVLAIVKKLQL